MSTSAPSGTSSTATQTNGYPAPHAGKMNQEEGAKWSVAKALAKWDLSYEESTNSPIPYFHLVERLKTTKRAGWCRFGIENPESISDHMYRMSRIIQLMPKSLQDRLDVKRCSDMALVHDMAEALVGDITPVDGVAKEEKSRRESETMDYICNNLLGQYEDGSQGRELRELWQEYEDSKTPESKFVHDVDKVELILQMYEYEERYKCEKDLGEFAWVTTKIETPEAKRMSDRILLDRVALWKKYGKEAKWPQDTKPETKMVP